MTLHEPSSDADPDHPGFRPLNGYSDRISVRPGETISFCVSCDGVQEYTARMLRIICADDNPAGAPFRSEDVTCDINGSHPGETQQIHAGSFVRVPANPGFRLADGFTFQALVMPTTPGNGRQAIIGNWSETGHTGASLVICDDGAAGVVAGDGQVDMWISTGVPLAENAWYRIAASYCAESGRVRVLQLPLFGGKEEERTATALLTPRWRDDPFLVAAWNFRHPDGRGRAGGHFNGRIEAPRVLRKPVGPDKTLAAALHNGAISEQDDVVAAWDFSRDISGLRVSDVSGSRLHGEIVNLPTRGVRGAHWTGHEMCWRHAPHEYGAIHFHEDDIHDAGWKISHRWTVPEGTRSGIYALHLTVRNAEEFIPFAVPPTRGKPQSDICFLMPTATYMAYANSGRHFRNDTVEMKQGRASVMTRADCFLQTHGEYGLSTYDTHVDGSGVSVSSRLRPILNLRPRTRVWGLVADTHLTSWLEHCGFAHDVVTDEELHSEGASVFDGYRVVMTGTHPEYYTREMLDGLETWVKQGGRLIYSGANGFYWRIAFHKETPGVIECRKTEGGTRSWVSGAGESFMSFTGEYGGLWRRSGRTPQQLTGIGFTAQGFDRSSFYRRTRQSRDPRVKFIFDGLEDEIIGNFGLVGGGAAGLELDRADRNLGTPPHALVVAQSEAHSDGMLVVLEELTSNQPVIGDDHPKVHADMTFFENENGGAVFSTGSIAFCSSLPCNGYDNNVARLMRNVVERFLDPAPFTDFDASRPSAYPSA